MRPWDRKRSAIMTKLKSCTCWVGDPQTAWQLYHGSSYSVVKVLSPTSGFWACSSSKGNRNSWGTWLWRPAGFDCRTSTVPGETKTPLLEGNFPHKILCALGHTGKEQWPHSWVDVMWTQTHLQKLVFRGDVSRVFSSPKNPEEGHEQV